MRKVVILAVVLAVAVVGGYKLYERETSLSHQSPAAVKALALSVLQGYYAAASAHDVAALSRYTYRLSSVCSTAASTTECNLRMDGASTTVAHFLDIKDQFKNVWYDDRQIILSTDWHLEETDLAIGEARSVIYFARAKDGRMKILAFTQPEEIVYSFIDPAQTHAELVKRLETRIVDSDYDGVSDEVETCTYEGAVSRANATASSTPNCTPTDPHKRDTDGDGWWDSTGAIIKALQTE